MFPSRYICQVLDEMRSCHKTRNYSGLLGLIEEAQSMANRMEAAIEEKHNYESYHKKAKEAKGKLRELEEQIKEKKEKLATIKKN